MKFGSKSKVFQTWVYKCIPIEDIKNESNHVILHSMKKL
jgi:hypothetical protein